MKTYIQLYFSAICFLGSLQYLSAAPSGSSQIVNVPEPTPYEVVTRDANSRVWEQMVYEKSSTGEVIGKKHSYTELATGLHYQKNGKWAESKEQIDILPDGTAQAIQGQHQAYFPGDIYSGVIELVTPDGQHLRSRPMGLSYYDGKESVLLAELTNSIGVVVGSNQVIYPNAFTDIKADLRYTYTKVGFEQDIILRQQPPTPESFRLDPDNARIEVLTEFFSPPQPTIQSTKMQKQAGLSLADQSLAFGKMRMVPGRAFLLGNDAKATKARVSKQWLMMDGRQFLVEEVPVDAIVEGLAKLPLTAMRSGSNMNYRVASKIPNLPKQRLAKANTSKPTMLARAEYPTQGFVFDYQTLNTSVNNYTFRGDNTYYISGFVSLFGFTTIEGGTIIKYDSGSSSSLTLLGSLTCQTESYRPAVLTAKDDNSIGESISGSSGAPSGYYGNCGLATVNYGYLDEFKNIRVTYLSTAFSLGADCVLSDMQVINCSTAFSISTDNCVLTVNNGLFSLVQTIFAVQDTWLVYGTHLTVHHCDYLEDYGGNTLYLANSLLVDVTNLASTSFTFVTNNVVSLNNDAGVFQTVRGGNYYLATNSPYRDVGTTNIDAELLAEIKAKSTYPPIVYSGATFTVSTNFSPRAQRDTNAPDLGYHYDPLDYVFSACEVDSNITFTAGTAVGWFRTASGYYHAGDGMHLMDNATATFGGTASAPDYWVRLNTVQEQDTSGGYGTGGISSWASGLSVEPTVLGNFLVCSMMGSEGNHFRDDSGSLAVKANNSEFWNGNIGGYSMYLNFTNCLFHRAQIGAQSPGSCLNMQNCTVAGGFLFAYHGGTWPVTIANSTFDGTLIGMDTSGVVCDYNAFITGSNRLSVFGAHDIVTNSFNWQSSWLGDYYLPTNSLLVNAGSTNANLLGLYHFTTQTGQVKETNSIVDIGYHYVATDGYGHSLDSNGNGNPDYLEDVGGNGQSLTVSLIAPLGGTFYSEPATIPVQASVTDWSSVVTNVDLVRGSVRIIGVTNSPYQYSWPIVAAGAYSLTAIARDLSGISATSAPVSITVTNLCSY